MSERLDVRRMLLKRGWTEDGRILRKDGALWAPHNDSGDSGISAAGRRFGLEFTADVPARIIAAIAEVVAADRR